MLKKSFLFLFLLSFNLVGMHQGPEPTYNFEYAIRSTCINSAEPHCYPAHYENADGSSNTFTNYVAYLNILAPVYYMTAYPIGNYYIKKWDRKIDREIKEQLSTFKDIENKLRSTLAEIIRVFDNGIGKEHDEMLARGLIEVLNNRGCQNCINALVKIVSQNDVDHAAKELNRTTFLAFVDQAHSSNCLGHEFARLESSSSYVNKNQRLCCKSSTNPCHWSSYLYFFGTSVLAGSMTLGIDVHNRAGSFVGDMANLVNALVIPTAYPISVFQQYKNLDRTKAKRLTKEIEKRFDAISGIIEIAGRVIGTMDNGIGIEQARGIIKALMLLNWPETLVKNFIAIASNSSNNKISFLKELKCNLEKNKVLYCDDDIADLSDKEQHIQILGEQKNNN